MAGLCRFIRNQPGDAGAVFLPNLFSGITVSCWPAWHPQTYQPSSTGISNPKDKETSARTAIYFSAVTSWRSWTQNSSSLSLDAKNFSILYAGNIFSVFSIQARRSEFSSVPIGYSRMGPLMVHRAFSFRFVKTGGCTISLATAASQL